MSKQLYFCLLAASTAITAGAVEGPVPEGMPHLDHVFVLMMENHGYSQVVNNPNTPFINDLSAWRTLRQTISRSAIRA